MHIHVPAKTVLAAGLVAGALALGGLGLVAAQTGPDTSPGHGSMPTQPPAPHGPSMPGAQSAMGEHGGMAGMSGHAMDPNHTGTGMQGMPHVAGSVGGRATQSIASADAKALGEAIPAGATVDTAHNQLTFTTGAVSFTVLAAPDTGPDMRFRVAGLINPTISVPQGATVTVQLIDADSDMSHGWRLTSAQPPFPTMAMMATPLAFPGAFATPLEPATSAAMAAETISFTAATAGQYTYLCPMPGHAEQGMYGTFVVMAL